MRDENINTEYKSIKIIKNREKGFKTLAETCVAFANTQGGTICIGVEDHQKQAPAGQRLEDKQINEAVNRVRSLCSNVAIQHTQILIDEETGGEYFKITVAPSQKSIATTSDGKIYQRVGDQCIPVRSEDIATTQRKQRNLPMGACAYEISHCRRPTSSHLSVRN